MTDRDPPRAQVLFEVDLTTEPLDVAAAHAFVVHDEAGGIGLFTGVVRNHHDGHAVDHLDYEAWEDRARDELDAVARKVAEAHPGVRRIHVSHRLGRLEVGDVSVICAASAPHRLEAITAAHELIDLVKEHVPIWKRETLADGEVRWPGC
ncbi:MAG TPA: molybdenum cofactor biosynthesis protein MoaE [Nitriliruptorales bacterium]|jgi:molybdopterin synthase catalytic subunit